VSRFRGLAARRFDWDHIMAHHADWGTVARQRSRGTVFVGLTSRQIKARVRSAWRNRERVAAQTDPRTGVTRVKYRGIDRASGQVIEMWANETTGTVETAYPVS
jgi:hypothetical protein